MTIESRPSVRSLRTLGSKIATGARSRHQGNVVGGPGLVTLLRRMRSTDRLREERRSRLRDGDR